MVEINNVNVERLLQTIKHLEHLADELVFLGGAVTTLYLSNPGANLPRPTTDVDAVINVEALSEYYAFGKKLKSCGFNEALEQDEPIYRWKKDDIVLDVIPLGGLGFTNKWHRKAVEHYNTIYLGDSRQIKIVSPSIFILTKIEAFKDRGNGRFEESHDLEDVVSLILGRSQLVDEVANESEEIRTAIQQEFAALYAEVAFTEALPYLAPYSAKMSEQIQKVKQIIQAIVA